MVRDFLGLRWANEEDTDDAHDDSAQTRGVEMQWSFSNKESHFLSFKSSQEEKPSSGFMTVSTLDSLDVQPKSQKISLEKQGSSLYPMAAYPLQQFGVRSHEPRMFPFSNQKPSSSVGQIACSSSINQNYLGGGGVPVMPPVSVLPTTPSGSFVGSTDISRTGNKQSGGPAQLTIFYAGSVNVFNDVSPEKAQAIMLLAGNGPSVVQQKPVPAPEVQSQFKRSAATNDYSGGSVSHSGQFLGLQINVPENTNVVSPPPVRRALSHVELPTLKSAIGVLESPTVTTQYLEPSRVICSAAAGTSISTKFPAVALPQARKASLARFLEKRKERITVSSPYHFGNALMDSSKKGTENLIISPQTAYS